MTTEPTAKPLLHGRGVLLVDDFCRSTGLGQDTVVDLMRTELRAAALWRGEELTDPFGIFDDMLPSREALVALGLEVRSGYEPDALRSVEMDDGS